MRPFRSLRALLVDVPPAHGRVIVRAMEEAGLAAADRARRRRRRAGGRAARAAAGARCSTAATGPQAVPARKALELVRLADPHLPFLAVSPFVHAGDLAAMVRGLDGAAAVVPDPAQLPRALSRALDATRLRRRVGGAHRFLLAQQAITDHVAAGLEPRRARGARARHARRDARLQLRRRLDAVARRQRAALRRDLASRQRGGRRRRARRRVAAAPCSPPARACPGACGRSGARRGSRSAKADAERAARRRWRAAPG